MVKWEERAPSVVPRRVQIAILLPAILQSHTTFRTGNFMEIRFYDPFGQENLAALVAYIFIF